MPSSDFISIPADSISPPEAYRLLIGSIIPRPIAYVSTLSPEGMGNLAPFSFFNGVCSNPPALMLSIARKPNGEKKDTLRNIESTKEFVVNSASEALFDQIVQSAAEYPFGVNEMEVTGLTPLASAKVKPNRVKESLIHFECKLYAAHQVGDGGPGSSTVVIGEIVTFHFSPTVFHEGRIDSAALMPLARLGGIKYSGLGQLRERAIPTLK